MKILVVDDEHKMGVILSGALRDRGHDVTTATGGREALSLLEAARFDLVLTDLKMAPPDGMAVLEETRQRWPATEVMLMTAYASAPTAVRAMQLGARDYLVKPFELEELHHRIDNLARSKNLADQVRTLKTENAMLSARVQVQMSFEGLIGRSPAMREVFELAEAVAETDSTVLIQGETGTGKGLLARAIHERSARRDGPFIKVNCGALPENLLESELFGHEKGAFTGAVMKRQGRFLAAQGGSLLLDEVGEMSMPLQVKLLQVIEEKTFMPVGGDRPVTADVRILAATHRDLQAMVASADFRQDLFFRLNVFPILLPPLRDRRSDIPLLIDDAIGRIGRDPADLVPAARELLTAYAYPGNVRELENLVERAAILSRGGPIRPEHFPGITPTSRTAPNRLGLEIPEEGIDLEELEKDLIRMALERTGGNKSRAARLLGLTRRTLYSRMEKHGIPLGTAGAGADGDDAESPAADEENG
jgi:two-component system response regulator AtoC